MSKKDEKSGSTQPGSKKKIKPENQNAEKINIKIAPGNWKRMEKFVSDFNNNPDRRTSKLKYTSVINEALSFYFENTIEK